MKFPYVVDATSDVARAFGATRTPEAFLFDAEGKLVYHGTIDDNAQEPAKVTQRYLDDALQAVSSGKEVTLRRPRPWAAASSSGRRPEGSTKAPPLLGRGLRAAPPKPT